MDFNRAERKALLLAAGLIGLAALGRSASGPKPDDLGWVAEVPDARVDGSVRSAPGVSAVGEAGPREAVEAALRRESRALTPLADGEKLDPNHAPEEELRRLPGIGPARARAIVQERARRIFEAPAALLRVPGIGPTTYRRIAPFLAVEGGLRQADPGPRAPPSDGCGADDRLDVNTATETELRGLRGIGPVLARRIVLRRTASGRFDGPDALLAVSGIGPRLLERLRMQICASGD